VANAIMEWARRANASVRRPTATTLICVWRQFHHSALIHGATVSSELLAGTHVLGTMATQPVDSNQAVKLLGDRRCDVLREMTQSSLNDPLALQ
jgi:hypothetical protein